MKAKEIYYKKLFSLGNFQNEEIGIKIEIEEGEKASDVLIKAKEFVNGLNPIAKRKAEYQDALGILEDKNGYNYERVMCAEKIVKDYEADKGGPEDLPF
jgi:hypothetical protein